MPFGRVAGMVVAHDGGWDEAALVAAPIALFAGLLWVAKRRADAERASADVADDETG